MRRLGDNIAEAFPTDVNGRPINEIPIMKGIRDIRQVKVVFTAATGLIGSTGSPRSMPSSARR